MAIYTREEARTIAVGYNDIGLVLSLMSDIRDGVHTVRETTRTGVSYNFYPVGFGNGNFGWSKAGPPFKIVIADIADDGRLTAIESVVAALPPNVDQLFDQQDQRIRDIEDKPIVKRVFLFDNRTNLNSTGDRYLGTNVYALTVLEGETLKAVNGVWVDSSTNVIDVINSTSLNAGIEGNLDQATGSAYLRSNGMLQHRYWQLDEFVAA